MTRIPGPSADAVVCFLVGLAGIVLVLCKLAGEEPVASWGWEWILAPFWAPVAVVVGGYMLIGVIAAAAIVLTAIFGPVIRYFGTTRTRPGSKSKES